MLTTTAERIIASLQGGGGRPFTIFVDRLLRAYGTIYGIPGTEIVTNVRVNLPDGGVDTEVLREIPGDATGLLGEFTMWQYKGTSYSDIEWSRLLDGEYLQNWLCAGGAFRLAIADDMPASTLATREAELWSSIKDWNPGAPRPRIVTASRLAELANRFPALVLATFYQDASLDLIHFAAWEASIRDLTPKYISIPERQSIERELYSHIDYSTVPPSAVRTVQGEAGVGKTRLVFETVRRIPGAEALVVYTLGSRALDVANRALNDGDSRLIMVADECDLTVRHQLVRHLNGHRTRIRVIAIDNTLVRADAPDPELVLSKMPERSLEAVLAANFPFIDEARLRAYSYMAEGFPGLAAELCRFDSKVPAHGDISIVLPKFVDFYRVRLSDSERDAMAALGLMMKLGYSGDVAEELRTWCTCLGISHDDMLRALHRVHDGPGFVGRTPRYLRVVPELIAKLAFADGWNRWAEPNPAAFLDSIPTSLLDEFIKRFRASASEEVRRVCAGHFRVWSDSVSPADLSDRTVVRRLESLAEAYPEEYLPRLRGLVEGANSMELLAVTGEGDSDGEWGPRRTLVWLAERFAQLPEHWSDAERILASLASAESEPNISNNATGIWGQGFRIILSGTATPFHERLERLRVRLRDERLAVRSAARTVLGAPLSHRASRMVGPAVIAGRIPPTEWRPSTVAEERACVSDVLRLYAEVAHWDAETRESVFHELLDAFRWLMATGHLTQVREIFESLSLGDDERVALINALDTAIRYDTSIPLRLLEGDKPELVVEGVDTFDDDAGPSDSDNGYGAVVGSDQRHRSAEHASALRAWRQELGEESLHTRILSLVGKERWSAVRLHNEDAWLRQVEELASEIVRDGSALEAELPWLTSGAAVAAAEFGAAIGRADVEAVHLDTVIATASTGEGGSLARGYARGVAMSHPAHRGRLIGLIDAFESEAPAIAVELALSVGPVANPLERVLRLYDGGLLSARYLLSRSFPTDPDGQTDPETIIPLLERLVVSAENGDELALSVGLENLAYLLPFHLGDAPEPVLVQHPELQSLAWRLFDAVPAGHVPPSHWWASLLGHLSFLEPERAARYLAGLLRCETIVHEDSLKQALAELAGRHAPEVMEAVGDVMLDDTISYKFYLGDYGSIFSSLPDDVKRAWLERAGVEGARRMARHLESPHVTDLDEAMVPPFTAWFLERFGDDDRTFREFVAGSHSWRFYVGDIASQHEKEAAIARRFLDHPLPRIREWARIEERRALADAAAERQRDAEQDLP